MAGHGGCTYVILAVGSLRQEDQEFKASLRYIAISRSARTTY
jgi:hypothetical protein